MWSNINKIKRKLNKTNNNFLKIYKAQFNKHPKNKFLQKKNQKIAK